MRIAVGTLLFVVALVCRPASQAPAPAARDAAAVIAVEREFAADGATRGWAASFRRYHAPDAIVLQPDPIKAEITLAKVEGDGPNTLLWRPAYAGIARSGDFGFTTGPVQIRGKEGVTGHYFTIWRKQADGGWKWIFDAGCEVRDPTPLPADADVPTLPVASSGAGSAKAAIDAVSAAEDAVSVDARGAVGRFIASLSADARVNRAGLQPAAGQPAAADLMRKDGTMTFKSLIRESSSSGDLVFTLGETRDQFEGKERLRYSARVWQLRPEGWRLVFDELVPRRVPQG
jgi:ketosteroid isomerase-like protein